jgi:hypothetical protein
VLAVGGPSGLAHLEPWWLAQVEGAPPVGVAALSPAVAGAAGVGVVAARDAGAAFAIAGLYSTDTVTNPASIDLEHM